MGFVDLFRGFGGGGHGSVGIGRTRRPDGVRREDEEFLLAHWTDNLVFTDALPRKGSPPQEMALPEVQLLEGEMSGTTFLTGNYTVRLATRAYTGGDNLTPANAQEVAALRQMGAKKRKDSFPELHLRHEVSARAFNRPQDPFRYVCCAAQGDDGSLLECVETICTAREDESQAFEDASLLVGVRAFDVGQTFKTWYRLGGDGVVSVLGVSDEPLR